MNLERVRLLKQGKIGNGPVIYWMSRDQRVDDNWALLYAQQLALSAKKACVVIFCLAPDFLGSTLRQYDFMLKGLSELSWSLLEHKIDFFFLQGDPSVEISCFVKKIKASVLVTDFDPLRIKQQWKKAVCKQITIPFYEVDAHNIVPCWLASSKQEFGAYTLRPKIHRNLSRYLEGFSAVKKHPHHFGSAGSPIHAEKILDGLNIDRTVKAVSRMIPGEKAAKQALRLFIKDRLNGYHEQRNDPVQEGQSGLSPYFHFGQLSPHRAALMVTQSQAPLKDKEAFLEELIIRRELSDNFCFYNPHYDSPRCVPSWAKQTLFHHAKDHREYDYTLSQLEKAQTHDDLWNAAQIQMVRYGKMHGYMRMYWAKKILEWTPSVEKSWKIAVYLNDRYELDGRDPNGYAGIAWALGGVHDRAWGERKIFGKIRYMNYNGCRSKFDVLKYIEKFPLIKEETGYEKV